MALRRWDVWAHAVIGTRGSWLPGDPRGFRDHGHRVHSSGDYQRPPPVEEHAGLHQFARSVSAPPLVVPSELRSVVAEAIGAKLIAMGHPARVIAVAGQHAHVLLSAGDGDIKPVVGRAKQAASHRVRSTLPGTIWSQGCHIVRVRDAAHYERIVVYIVDHAEEGAALWVHPSCRIREVLHPDLRQASGPASDEVSDEVSDEASEDGS